MIHEIFKNVKTDTEKHSSSKKKAQVRLLLKYVSKITTCSNVVNDMCRCFLKFWLDSFNNGLLRDLLYILVMLLNLGFREFLGGSVIRTPCFRCQGQVFSP